MKPKVSKWCFVLVPVTIVCLLAARQFIGGQNDRLIYNGKSIGYWEKQAYIQIPQGNEKAVQSALEKMGPEAVPFWLERLVSQDSSAKRGYAKLWMAMPNRMKGWLPVPVAQSTRRNVASLILGRLYYTNGIPELISLSYSKDAELQRYAVCLLWSKSFHFYHPSKECIAAFTSAFKTGDAFTRRYAVDGLAILPVQTEALPVLQAALNDGDSEIRTRAAAAIKKWKAD
jgi:hypothetical protein